MAQSSSCLILQYHRVALLAYDPLRLAVQPHRFEEQIEYLSKNFNVISINDMTQHLEKLTPFEDRSVVVTFDIGYTDVLYTAKEILEKSGVCATVFAASASMIKRKQFWWDDLEDFLIASLSLNRLEMEIGNQLYCWPLITQYHRFQAYNELYSILCDKPPAEQSEIVEQFAINPDSQAGESDNHRIMNAQEIKKLGESDLIVVGGHTHNCANLSLLGKCEQIEEISKNKEILEEILGRPVEYFSYPFVNNNIYPDETINLLKNLGFALACGNSYGTVSINGQINRYNLPRVRVENWNAFSFHKFLTRFFE
jgi:peptidoglycan/xylan/chitin deacetylase (PgdA/CDA1 family)